MSRPVGSAVAASSTSISWPRKGSLRPCERAEAKNRTVVAGKSRSSSSAAHHLAHLTGGTYYANRNHLTPRPRIHRGLFLAAEAECFMQRDDGLI